MVFYPLLYAVFLLPLAGLVAALALLLAAGARRGRATPGLLLLGLGLSYVALDAWFGPFNYAEIWYAFAVRGGLVLGLAVVGLQASYAATVERRQAVASVAVMPRQPYNADEAAPASGALAVTVPLPSQPPEAALVARAGPVPGAAAGPHGGRTALAGA
ncbi:hypothetical protein [Hymenobacter terricola]|uniref:hypothetical protein n=1 Tax=Hymenobacter terricola TaxID=2819236 RepID=UPI001B31599F|nr:hypothetical protein [Hymenobacter terricola]